MYTTWVKRELSFISKDAISRSKEFHFSDSLQIFMVLGQAIFKILIMVTIQDGRQHIQVQD